LALPTILARKRGDIVGASAWPRRFFMPDFYQADFLTRRQIDELQLSAFRGAIERAKRAPSYAQTLADVSPGDIKSLDDVRKVPFTTKDDLRKGMPYGFLAVPKSDVVRMHYSSGTTGVATAIYHTRQDVQWWSECVARGLVGVGVTALDVFQNMMGYGLFTGGLGLHYAAELVGCMTIPASSGNTQRQVQLMQQFETTAVHILPSYAMRVVHYCQQNGIDPKTGLGIKYAFLGAEPHTERMRQRIEHELNCRVYNCYGLSEMCGPGVALECPEQAGLHVREDHYLAEIVDPQTLQPVEPGQQGELVLTTLNRQANPLLRYRTRDITALVDESCPCGREHRRITRIVGRTDDMFIVKGCNIYPIQVERVLMDVEEVGANYLIALGTSDDLDEMTISVELREDVFFDHVRMLDAIRQRIVEEVRSETLVTPKVELLQPHSLPTTEGKAVRVVDNRKEAEEE